LGYEYNVRGFREILRGFGRGEYNVSGFGTLKL
jgi:hypothetical protein